MRYITIRQSNIGLGFLFFLSALCLGYGQLLMNRDNEIMPKVKAACIFIVGIMIFVYFLSYNVKRNMYKKLGKCIPGRIVGADVVWGRHENSYHLKISFYDDGEKMLYTEAYKGHPGSKLKSSSCNIYKWKGRYIEADFDLKSKREVHQGLTIPIQKRKSVSLWEIGKVKEV